MTDTIVINQGWLWLSDDLVANDQDYLKLYFKKCFVSYFFDVQTTHFAGGGHYSFYTGKKWLEFVIQDIMCPTHANFSTVVDYIKDWVDNQTSFYIEIKRDSSNNLVEWDGDNTQFKVTLKNGLVNMEKTSLGNGTIFRIRKLELVQTS